MSPAWICPSAGGRVWRRALSYPRPPRGATSHGLLREALDGVQLPIRGMEAPSAKAVGKSGRGFAGQRFSRLLGTIICDLQATLRTSTTPSLPDRRLIRKTERRKSSLSRCTSGAHRIPAVRSSFPSRTVAGRRRLRTRFRSGAVTRLAPNADLLCADLETAKSAGTDRAIGGCNCDVIRAAGRCRSRP